MRRAGFTMSQKRYAVSYTLHCGRSNFFGSARSPRSRGEGSLATIQRPIHGVPFGFIPSRFVT